MREVTAPHADSGAQKLEENAQFESQPNSIGILHGMYAHISVYSLNSNCLFYEVCGSEDDTAHGAQTRVAQDLTLQQGDLAPTCRVLNVPHQEVNSDSMQHHAKLRSVLRRVMELERRLGAMRDNRFLRRERIQLGLEFSVIGERGVSVSEFPFMMVLFAFFVVIIPSAYKYYA